MTKREKQILNWIKENPMISQQDLADKAGITRSSAAVHISNLIHKGYIAGKGYVFSSPEYVVVIGGANVDIGGKPYQPLVEQDSNPGKVTISFGGVGRNIAHNLALLRTDVKMITAFGGDVHASELMVHCNEVGIDITHSLQLFGESTSTYLFITDEHGEMELAISDMDIYRHITPKVIEENMQMINRAKICLIDTNIPEKTITWLAKHSEAPVFADPVSVAKAGRLKEALPYIHTIKPNRLEAELLTGISITDEESLQQAAERFLNMGLQQVFISLGAEGIFCCNQTEMLHLRGRQVEIINSTGAGDSVMAGLTWSWLKGKSLKDAGELALTAGALCLESSKANNPKLSPELLEKYQNK